jgi:Xaa-Arg dipeptidase
MFSPEVKAVIETQKKALRQISKEIFDNPEIGHEEYNSSKLIANYLQSAGFELQYPYGGLETAFRATYGQGKPNFCIMCEYDALPGIGHACGHHLIATAAVAAGVAVKKIMETHSLSGTVIVLGTPAEEGSGGKVDLIDAGAFADIDACILCHPFCQNGIDPGNLAVSRFDVEFSGQAAHAAAAPDQGINALDAINLLFAGINAWRQHLPDTSRVHGIISAGGVAANIIPEHTAGNFYLRSLSNEDCADMEEHFRNIVKGAALMTGCDYTITKLRNSYQANLPNPVLDEFVNSKLAEMDMAPEQISGRISTDYGNVSQIIPGCNFFFSVCETKSNAALHSEKFKELAGMPYAFEQCLKAGEVMALTALEFISNKISLS